jgi:hypothetical protein
VAYPAVYSTVFIRLQGLVGSATFVVPDGYIAILRDADVYNGGGIESTSAYLIDFTSNGTITRWVSATELQAFDGSWRGRQVFNSGDSFGFNTTGAWDVRLSGYLLLDT